MRTLLANMPGVAYRCRNDKAWTMEFVSQGAHRLTGYSPEDLIGNHRVAFGDLIHKEDRERVGESVRAACAAGRPFEFEYRIRTAQGAERFVWEQGVGIAGPSGEITALEGIIVDVTARRQAERALHESEDRFRAFFEEVPDSCFIVSLEGQVLATNRAAGRLLGRERHELAGLVLADLCTHETRPKADALRAQLLARGRVDEQELVLLASDGSQRTVQLSAGVVRSSQGTPLYAVAILRDLTAYRQVEAQLRQAQKMEAVGRLAGGVAHDFNNLMGIINGQAEMALDSLPEDHPATRRVDQILETVRKAANVTRQLLAFSRQQTIDSQPVDLNAVVSDVAKMLERLIGEDVALELRLGVGLATAALDAGQMEQVLLNLAVNARDAMPRGGRLTIGTDNVDLAQAEPAWGDEQVPAGSYVRLTVTDTGVGMDGATLARIFEPFFTTKPIGKGTGLGLSVVYGIVRQSDGHLAVESSPGRGATFHLYFPRLGAEPSAADPAYVPAAPRAEGETVLVVEDEEALREILVEILQTLGYDVLTAGSGLAALNLVQGSDKRIDLLVTDVVMPHMRGDELAFALSTVQPALRVLFISGYPDEVTSRFGLDLSQAVLLQKPFRTPALAQKVREALASAPYSVAR